jgi:(S)-mandelate dehydrogenase
MAESGPREGDKARAQRLRRRFPTIADLRARARARVPRFAFDFVDGGANDETCVERNVKAFRAVELLPHYCVDTKGASIEVELFGTRYAAPIGMAPMGSPGLMWPGAEEYMAQAAQRARIPFVLATPGNASIERIAELAPDVFWFQLYRFPYNDHAITFDLVRRADAAGARVLVPTVDSAGKSKRPRDIRNGVALPFPITAGSVWQVATSPAWAWSLLKHGMPRTENLVPYAGPDPTQVSTGRTMQLRSGGSHTWEELARLRERWKRAFVVKGILHPQDAEQAVALGADGIIVSNHGGRHFDGAPATIDVLPAIVAAVACHRHGRQRHPRRPRRGAGARARRQGRLHRPALPVRPGGARPDRRHPCGRPLPRGDPHRIHPYGHSLGGGGGRDHGAPSGRLAGQVIRIPFWPTTH